MQDPEERNGDEPEPAPIDGVVEIWNAQLL